MTSLQALPTPRRLLALFATLLALALGAAAPDAHAQSNNVSEAVNTEDGSSVFDFAFSIQRVGGDVVDQTNTAVAYSSCQDCQTVAVALQVVLVMSQDVPSTITPQNVAIAVNEGCTSCQTVALAYQYVIGHGGPVRFTRDGRREIARIRRAFKRLREQNLPLDKLLAEVEKLRVRLRIVLRDELVPVGRDGQDESTGRDEGRAGEDDGPDPGSAEPEEPAPGEQPEDDEGTPTTPAPPPDGTEPPASTETTPAP